MCICDPKMTALIFASGKMIVTGAKLEDYSQESQLASQKYACIVQKSSFKAKFSVGQCQPEWRWEDDIVGYREWRTSQDI